MKEIAKLKQLPPVYTGKWASATAEEVQEELERGTPYTYRFRVPKEGSLKIDDLIRGEVSSVLVFFFFFFCCMRSCATNNILLLIVSFCILSDKVVNWVCL